MSIIKYQFKKGDKVWHKIGDSAYKNIIAEVLPFDEYIITDDQHIYFTIVEEKEIVLRTEEVRDD